MSRPADRCGVTGKLMFATKAEARKALEAWAWKLGSRQVTRRCLFCLHYHLSKGARSKPMKG